MQPQSMVIDNPQEFEMWWKAATSSIYDQQRLIHSVCINEIWVYQNYEEYILKNFNSIKKVDVKTLSSLESIQQTEETLGEYLSRFVDSSMELSQHFYGELSEEDWRNFSAFIEGLDWIIKAIEFERLLYQRVRMAMPNHLELAAQFPHFIAEMEINLNEQDYVAVGDLIQYEIVPLLKQIHSNINLKD